MAAQLAVEMTADDAKLWRAMQRSVKSVKDFEKELKRLQRTSKQGEKAMAELERRKKGAFSTKSLRGFVTGLTGAGGVLGAIALVSKGLADLEARGQKALQTQVSLAGAQDQLKRNLVGTGMQGAAVDDVLAQGRGIADETGTDARVIFQALANGVSASGGDVEGALSAVRQSAKFLGTQPESIADFAGSLLDLRKVTGSDDADLNMGLLSAVGTMSRVVDPRQQAMNIPKALIGQQNLGATANEAAALFAATTNASADLTGESSGTAVISLVEQLRDFSQKEGLDKRISAVTGREATVSDRIAFLQQNQGTAKAFLEEASFEKKFIGPFEQLFLNAGSDIARTFSQNLSGLGSDDALRTLGQSAIAELQRGPLAEQAAAERDLARIQQRLESGADTEFARASTALTETERAAGLGGLFAPALRGADKALFLTQTAAGMNPSDSAAGILEGRARDASAAGNDSVAADLRAAAAVLRETGAEKLNQAGEKLLEAAGRMEQAMAGGVNIGRQVTE